MTPPVVAVVTSVHPAGDGRILHKQVHALVRAGFQVVYLAPGGPGAAQAVETTGAAFVPLRAGGGRSVRPRRWVEIVRHLRRLDPDVVHVHDPELAILAAVARVRRTRRPLRVYDAHEDLAATLGYKDWIPRMLRRPLRRVVSVVEGWAARRMDAVVAATDPIARSLARRGVDATVVRNLPRLTGTGLASDPPPRPCRTLRVVYAGSISRARGVDEFVEVARRVPEVSFTLAGPFASVELESEVLAAAPANLVYAGRLEWSAVPELLRSGDIGWCCLHPEPNYVESLPTKLFEYMAAGMAVVASDFPAWRAFVDEVGSGVRVDPCDVDALETVVRELAGDPEGVAEMGRRGRRAVLAEWTWESECERLLGLYEGFERELRS